MNYVVNLNRRHFVSVKMVSKFVYQYEAMHGHEAKERQLFLDWQRRSKRHKIHSEISIQNHFS